MKSKHPIPKSLTVRQQMAVLRDEVACLMTIVGRLRRRVKALESRPPSIVRYNSNFNP